MTSLYDLRVPGFILNINSRPPTHRGPELTVKNLSLLPSLAVLISLLAAVGLTGCTTAAAEPLPPTATDTPPAPTETATPTIVWFPPTATYTPPPTAAIRITPTVDVRPVVGDVIFSDDFSDPELWSLGKTGSGSAALGKNELTIAISEPGAYLYSLRQQTNLRDFYLEITASPNLCRSGDEYGLLLRVNENLEFYRFGLNCSGQVRLDKFFSGRASSPYPLTYSGAVPPGAPSISRLGVLARGKELTFFVNGQQVFVVEDPSLPSGTIGVFARSNGDTPVTINFSALEVFEIG
jgi:hypothetical protein